MSLALDAGPPPPHLAACFLGMLGDRPVVISICFLIIIIIEGLSLLQSMPPTTANKQMQAQKKGGAGLESC